MICISVTPESRSLAKVDLLNASRYADLIELCLDRLLKAPDVGEMTKDLDKPVIVSCRRDSDGGHFKDSEETRISLLKQAIISGPAYVELDLKAAKVIPRFGETKRVISITSLNQPIENVDQIFEEAWKVKPDVVKFTWLTQTFDDAYPLLKAVVDKREVPVVGIGIGRCGITFSLLGRKYGSPWLYAALEKGMETLPGQTTAFDLDEIYDFRNINARTRFLGLVGYNETQPIIAKILNHGFKKADSSFRCLPFHVRSLDKVRRRLEILKISGMFVNPALSLNLHEFPDKDEEAVRKAQAADLLFHKQKAWHGYNLLWRVMLKAIDASLEQQGKEFHKQNALVFGDNPLARSMIYGLQRRKCVVSITSSDDRAARSIAQSMGVRQVPFMNLYDTFADIAVIADANLQPGPGKSELNPAFFRKEMTVADFSRLPLETSFSREAAERGCRVIDPRELGYHYLSALFKAITGEELDRAGYDRALGEVA